MREELQRFKERNGGSLAIPDDGSERALKVWVSEQRREFKRLEEGRASNLRARRMQRPTEVGFDRNRPALIEPDTNKGLDPAAQKSDPVAFVNGLIELHTLRRNQWFIVPTMAAEAGCSNALPSNNLLSKMIGISDEAFSAGLFSGARDADSIEAKIKYLEETFNVKVAKLQFGLSCRDKETGKTESTDDGLLCINFRHSEGIKTESLNESLFGSRVPVFCENAIDYAKRAILSGNSFDEYTVVVTSFMNQLKEASEPKKAWYILFSQKPDVRGTASYAKILKSPRLLSNMIDIETDIFATQLLKGKRPRQNVSDFLSQTYHHVHVIPYKKVHQILFIGYDYEPGSWTPGQDDLASTPDACAAELAQRMTQPHIGLTPLEITTSPNTDDNDELNLVTPMHDAVVGGSWTDSNSFSSLGKHHDVESLANNDGDEGSYLEGCGCTIGTQTDAESKQYGIDEQLRLLVEAAPRPNEGTCDTAQRLQVGNKTFPFNEDGNQWSRDSYAKARIEIIKPILHSWVQKDPKKLYQVISLMIEDDENLRRAFQQEFINFAQSNRKEKKGFAKVLSGVVEAMEECHHTEDELIVESLREFFVALSSKGTRPKKEQQAVDAVLTAVIFKNFDDESVLTAIKKRLGVTPQSVEKCIEKVTKMNASSLEYVHSERARRKDCKEDIARKFVYDFCHNLEAGRAVKVDTGDFTYTSSYNPHLDCYEKHKVLRWIDCATKDDVYKKWLESNEAKQLGRVLEGKELTNTIGQTVFNKLVCNCCRFGKKDQCSDLIMSEAEEARGGLEKAFKDKENEALCKQCDVAFQEHPTLKSFQSCLRAQGETIIEATLCPRQTFPTMDKQSNPPTPCELHHLDCVEYDCRDCGVDGLFKAVKDVIDKEASDEKLYSVHRWKKVPINNTDKYQYELREDKLTLPELFQHFMSSLERARRHYVWYKMDDWMIDLFKYNALKEDANLGVFEADFAATPDLCSNRTANAQVMTHAVIEPFIYYEPVEGEEEGTASFIRRSFIYIGGCEGKGKRNGWQFHNAALEDVIERVNERRTQNGRDPLETVISITDRCPTQYLCRQNIFQISKSGTKIIHVFACKHRFKGVHDSEGGVIKQGNKANVTRGEAGATPFEFYEGAVKEYTLTDEGTEGKSIRSRDMFFVTYDKEERESLNTGQNKGRVIYADMNNQDDTEQINRTQNIFMVSGFGGSPQASILIMSDEKLQNVENELNNIDGINRNSDTDDQFYEHAKAQKDDLSNADQARLDFIRCKRGEIKDSEGFELKKRTLEYKDEFLTRIGSWPLPKSTATKNKHIRGWIDASRTERIYKYREKTSLVKLYNKVLRRSVGHTKFSKIDLMREVLGIDLSEEFDEDAYYVRLCDVPCPCKYCRMGDYDKCESPFKDHMRSRVVKLKQVQTKGRGVCSLSEEDELIEDEDTRFDDMQS